MPKSSRTIIMTILPFLAFWCFFTLSAVAVYPEPFAENSTDFSWANQYGKSPTQFSVYEWREIIDARWGTGLPTTQKLQLFDRWWNEVNIRFGAFHNLEVDIMAMRDQYRPEIEAGVSRGRFSGIMNHFTYRLKELHTYIFDIPVRNTRLVKGVPILVIGQWGTNQHFGALLTPLPDSTLLVYKTLPGHPIGLQPGDLVLGYDGKLWKDIYPTLLEAELPYFPNSVNASTDEANAYYMLQAAGLNWHLFDTIDIVKFSTGDTLHFSTSLLAGQSRTIWGSEQIDVPGVVWPNRSQGDRVNWGVVQETNIGYVYVTSWSFDAQFAIRAQFREAIDKLMNEVKADGIILDFRFNTGGGALAVDGLSLLFNQVTPTVGFDRRIRGSSDPLAMEPDPLRRESNLVIRPDPTTYYDKPIAVLIGPGSISAGELEARRLSFHPRVRLFGKTAPGGNTGSSFIDLGNSNWFASLSDGSMYLVSNHQYLAHIGLEPHEYVWFTQVDVANGVDTVVEAALEWIDSENVTGVEEKQIVGTFQLKQNYPNPFNPSTTITYFLKNNSDVTLKVYNVLGQAVRALVSERQTAGLKSLIWNGDNDGGHSVSGGVYIYRIEVDDFVQSKKMVLIR